jgi:hypothetical protein
MCQSGSQVKGLFMTINEFSRELHRHPFQPFTLVTITGAQFIIDHPEFAAIDRRGRVVTFYAADNTRHEVDTRLIERIIALDIPDASVVPPASTA